MHDYKINPLKRLYIEHLETISEIHFTRREIDIVSCILSGKETKTIATLLSVSPRTVETHIYNIFSKLKCTSRENIIDFIETSGKFSLIQKYYWELLDQRAFEKGLKKISLLLKKKPFHCLLIYKKNLETLDTLMDQLKIHLTLAGIRTGLETKKDPTNLSHFSQNRDPSKMSPIVYIGVESFITHSLKRENKSSLNVGEPSKKGIKNVDSRAILILDKEDTSSIDQEILHLESVSFEENDTYYHFFNNFLKKLLPRINVEKVFSESYNESRIERRSTIGKSILPIKNKIIKNSPYKKISLIFLMSILTICMFFYISFVRKQEITDSIRSELSIPTQNAFLNRPELIKKMEEKLKATDTRTIDFIGITGIGGIGKTTLAREVGRKHEGSVVWEINAETKRSLLSSFKNLAYALAKMPSQKDELEFMEKIQDPEKKEAQLLFLVKNWLKEKLNWLLIYDNVENFFEIKNYFPEDSKSWGKGKVIITTRNSNLENTSYIKSENVISVEELIPEEKLTFFSKIFYNCEPNKLTCDQKEKATNFLKNIPPFPLDISVVAYYLKNTQISYEQYLKYIESHDKDFKNLQHDILNESEKYNKTRYELITLALERLIKHNKDFLDLLLILATVDSQDIPKDLLINYKDSVIADDFIHNLKKYSLVTHESIAIPQGIFNFSIHRSTQEIILNYLSQKLDLEKNHQFLNSIAHLLGDYIADGIEKEQNTRSIPLMVHCEIFLKHGKLLTDEMRGIIGGELGRVYLFLGDFAGAKKLIEESLCNLNKYPSTDYVTVGRISSYLGIVYQNLGDREKAKALFEKSLNFYEKNPSKNAAGIAQVSAYLGAVYKDLGDCEKAEDFVKKSLQIYEQQSSKNFGGIARNLAFLGVIYRERGQYIEAKNFLEESLSLYEKHFSETHSGVGMSSALLGDVYKELGQYEKAKSLFDKSLRVCKKNYSENHIAAARGFAYLGDTYKELGDYEKAKELLEKSLKIYKNNLPETHPAVARVLGYLGNVYDKIGQLDLAKTYLESSLTALKSTYSQDNIHVIWSSVCLGNIYGELGDYEKAKILLKGILEESQKNYGENHIATADILMHLGKIYILENNWNDAKETLNKALTIFAHNNHPKAYLCLENLAELYLKKSAREKETNNIQKSKDFKKIGINYLKESLKVIKKNFPKISAHMKRVQFKLDNLS